MELKKVENMVAILRKDGVLELRVGKIRSELNLKTGRLNKATELKKLLRQVYKNHLA